MATRKPTDTKHKDALPGEADVARVYRAGAKGAPPASLDARILAEAQRALQKPASTKPFHLRWAVPLSTAAVVVLAVSVGLLMTKEGTLDKDGNWTAPNEYSVPPAAEAPVPASPPPLAGAREAAQATAPAKAKRAAPEPAKPLAGSVESRLAKQAPAETMKKAEAPPAAAAPQAIGRAQEADRITLAREEKARARSVAAGVAAMKTQGADVTAVQASGAPGAYSFNVTVKSPDTGCQQYADWWEVVSEDGKLLYRRVLLHSHVDEQPFTRSGGPVMVHAETVVWVRAHMNTSGYNGVALKGSLRAGFKPAVPDAGFAAGLAKRPPLPEGCDF